MPSKTLTRTVAVNCFGNKLARRILRSAEDAYRRMVEEMAEYAVRHNASQATLHKAFYARFGRTRLEA